MLEGSLDGPRSSLGGYGGQSLELQGGSVGGSCGLIGWSSGC